MLKLYFPKRVIPIITGTNIAEGKWTAIAMTMDKASQEVEVFVKGQPVYRNASFSFSTQHILNVNDTIELQGGSLRLLLCLYLQRR